MRERDLSFLVVLDHNGTMVGMVTMRDINGGKKKVRLRKILHKAENSFQRIGDSWRKKKSPSWQPMSPAETRLQSRRA